MMLMKTGNRAVNDTDWAQYIDSLTKTELFRGGSALGAGFCMIQTSQHTECTVSGFMRFEADSIEQILALIHGNPVYEAGGEVEVLELLLT